MATRIGVPFYAQARIAWAIHRVATPTGYIYDVPMPSAVSNLLSVFNGLNLNIDGIGLPLQCLGLGTFFQRLLLLSMAPLVLAALLIVGFVIDRGCSCCAPRATTTPGATLPLEGSVSVGRKTPAGVVGVRRGGRGFRGGEGHGGGTAKARTD